MRERPIIFSAPMIRALQAGTKTQTRRVLKTLAHADVPIVRMVTGQHRGCYCILDETLGVAWYPYAGSGLERYPTPADACPYGVPGDRLWVKETHRVVLHHGQPVVDYRADDDSAYLADDDQGGADSLKWTPSIFMRRWFSRITLEITDVRVERLNAISDHDARAEGMDLASHGTAPARFAELWESINGKRAPWSSNPWVWALTFRRLTP